MNNLIKQIEELNLRCDSSTLIPIIEQVERLCKERDAALAVVDEFIIDTTTNNETPIHECAFLYDPEKGKCDACEAWGNYVGLFCSREEEEMACDTLSQEVSQEGSKLPIISSNGIRITEYIPPQNSAREIPPYGAYTTGECTLSVHNKEEKL